MPSVTASLKLLTGLLSFSSHCLFKQTIFSYKSHPNTKKLSQNCSDIEQNKPNTNKGEESDDEWNRK